MSFKNRIFEKNPPASEKEIKKIGSIDAGAIGTAQPGEWFCFSEWVENGCMMRSENDSLSDEVDIMIIAVPDDRIKFLVEIQKVFSLKIPMSEFRKNIENLPYVIVKDIKYAKAKKLIAKLKYPECVAVTEHF